MTLCIASYKTNAASNHIKITETTAASTSEGKGNVEFSYMYIYTGDQYVLLKYVYINEEIECITAHVHLPALCHPKVSRLEGSLVATNTAKIPTRKLVNSRKRFAVSIMMAKLFAK